MVMIYWMNPSDSYSNRLWVIWVDLSDRIQRIALNLSDKNDRIRHPHSQIS